MPAAKRKSAPKRSVGRPSRAEASAKALAAAGDLAEVDPKAVLRQIAADTSAPATARVQACRALMQKPDDPADAPDPVDDVTAVALRLLASRQR